MNLLVLGAQYNRSFRSEVVAPASKSDKDKHPIRCRTIMAVELLLNGNSRRVNGEKGRVKKEVVLLVPFGAEEQGLLGSKLFLRIIRLKLIIKKSNFYDKHDMVG